MDWDSLEKSLASVLDPALLSSVRAHLASAEASQPEEVSPTTLSKLWMVKENLAEGAIEQNTLLDRDSISQSSWDSIWRRRRISSSIAMATLS